MQLQRFKWFARTGVLVSLSVFLAATAGCPSNPPPPNGNGDNGDPPPGDVDVTLVGNGVVRQEEVGSLVKLTADPDPGWVFVGWSGADVDDPTAATITVDADEVPAVTATFEAEGPAACEIDAECDDGVYCNGSETCQSEECAAGSSPCTTGEVCIETTNDCAPDRDGDGVPDSLDSCPDAPNPDQADTDGDGIDDACDNCPADPNADQADTNEDGVGDACAGDADGDDIPDESDNCPLISNVDQADADADGTGDICDTCPSDPENDADRDGVCGDVDQCADTPPRVEVDETGCPPPPECGNGVLELGEDCDPPNGETCDSNCQAIQAGAVCGNGVEESGEECDDGNTTPGDGCDATCRLEAAGLANDNCANPAAVADGETITSNVGATTDGPDEPSMCDVFEYTQVGSDIWFCYQATCSDPAIVSLCGSSYDTKMAVYEGCDCPSVVPIACSDDDCGTGFESRITFQATVGQSYLIRIGGFEGAQGEGTLNILCGQEVCAPGSGDCSTDTGTRGCDDVGCCNTTCTVDPYCCDVEWDQLCADESAGLCTGSFAACASDAGSCATAHEAGAAGCSEVDCCNSVCMQDPFCCVDMWDDLCVQTALGTCFLACGNASDGGCFTANGSAGCETVACCQAVCVDGTVDEPADLFCCDTEWDQQCAEKAAAICRGLP